MRCFSTRVSAVVFVVVVLVDDVADVVCFSSIRFAFTIAFLLFMLKNHSHDRK